MITDTLNWIGVYAPGETISNADAQQCLTRLNDMLDSWSNESMTCYAILEQTAPLVAGQWQYTIGPGGNFNMTRPLSLIKTYGTVYVQDTNGNRYNLEVLERAEWNLIGNIVQTNSNYPQAIFYDPQYPLGVINLFPVPNVNYTLYWDSYLQFTDLAGLTSTTSFPPGYIKALKDNLALEVWPYFKTDGSMPSKLMIAMAARSKGNIKRLNYRLNIAQFDPELVRGGQSSYNIYSDNASPRGNI